MGHQKAILLSEKPWNEIPVTKPVMADMTEKQEKMASGWEAFARVSEAQKPSK